MATKGYILNGAFAFLRISGIVSESSSEDIAICLPMLDNKLAEMEEVFNIGYIQPSEAGTSDKNDNSGLAAKFIGPIQKIFAVEMCSIFGKTITPELYKIADQGLRTIEHICVCVGPSQMPDTLPRGKANESYTFNRYYGVEDHSPEICSSEELALADTYDYTISWDDWLQTGASVTGYTIDVSAGLTLVSSQLQENDVYFKVTGAYTGTQTVKIKVTSSDEGRVDNRIVYFNVKANKTA